MRKHVVSIALVLGLVLTSRAQVSVEIVMEQEHFLVGESIPVAVRITNRSGQTLHMGEDPNWLTFALETRESAAVIKNGEVPVEGAFELASGKMATRRVDLAPYFDLSQRGRYHLTASVHIKEWDSTLAAKPKSFDIVKGAKLWSQEFGMLLPAGVTNRVPEVRRYSLEQANYLRSQVRLYLRVTDAEGARVIKVVPVGPMVSVSSPDQQIDRLNNLHLLYQTGARAYLYMVFTPEGEILTRQTHEITTSRPRLIADERGNLSVQGGARRTSDDDLPASAGTEAHEPSSQP